ncbi:hypothetical protein [Streptomyces sp. MK37H]|uniref:hypothetical protein n=1 Tax=Streptomyces sp. MK37H TaxID=2699117 RepID=UPI001B36BBD2|nr:hypothetical protein [Streptomyces sp. MK37H]
MGGRKWPRSRVSSSELGRDTGLIEIPAQWELDDFPQFAYNDIPAEPRGQDRIAGTDLTLDNWRREFDGYYALRALLRRDDAPGSHGQAEPGAAAAPADRAHPLP